MQLVVRRKLLRVLTVSCERCLVVAKSRHTLKSDVGSTRILALLFLSSIHEAAAEARGVRG